MLCLSGSPMVRSTQKEHAMNTQQLTFVIPPYGTATLCLPEMLTVDDFTRLSSAVDAALGDLPRDVDGRTTATDPGSIEFDSWRVHAK